MDRQKYVHNQDYRDGYDEGVEAGRYQMKKQIEYVTKEIRKVLNTFQDAENEDAE